MKVTLDLRVATDNDVECFRELGFMYFEYSAIKSEISPQPFFIKQMNNDQKQHFRELFNNAQIYIPKNLTEIFIENGND